MNQALKDISLVIKPPFLHQGKKGQIKVSGLMSVPCIVVDKALQGQPFLPTFDLKLRLFVKLIDMSETQIGDDLNMFR